MSPLVSNSLNWLIGAGQVSSQIDRSDYLHVHSGFRWFQCLLMIEREPIVDGFISKLAS